MGLSGHCATLAYLHRFALFARHAPRQGYASQCRGEAWDPQGAASFLAHTARKRWESLSAVVDDITAMVVRLNLSPQ